MKLEYDDEADAAYLYLQYPVKEGEAKKTVEVQENILLDFDANNKLIGIEILSASKILRKTLLNEGNMVV